MTKTAASCANGLISLANLRRRRFFPRETVRGQKFQILLDIFRGLSYVERKFFSFCWEAGMKRNKQLVLATLGLFLTGCTGMTKTQAAIVGASFCGISAGAGVGASRDNDKWIAAPAAIGSALLCGGLAYL